MTDKIKIDLHDLNLLFYYVMEWMPVSDNCTNIRTVKTNWLHEMRRMEDTNHCFIVIPDYLLIEYY